MYHVIVSYCRLLPLLLLLASVALVSACDDNAATTWEHEYTDDNDYPPIPCPDEDNDGYTDLACGGTDCVDSDPSIHPGADEDCNGIDNDCDGIPADSEVDFDGDGFWECQGDCNPTDPSVHPDAYDICGDIIDNNCDGWVDNTPVPDLELPGFILGIGNAKTGDVPYLLDMGISWVRPSLTWKEIEPEIFQKDLAVNQVRSDPQMVEAYSLGRDWSSYDEDLKAFTDAGITPLPVIGHGYGSNHPDYQDRRASPDVLGKQNYLGHIYLAVRATVERYDGDGYLDNPYGIELKLYQIENELNQAYFTSLWGWREPQGIEDLFNAWSDWDFLTELLATLNTAVKDSNPETMTTMNFHTDVHDDLCRALNIPTWPESITLWRDLVDIVGIDAYPNYYLPEPVRGTDVGERVATAYECGCGKPVIILECGYPNGPDIRGFDTLLQAQFIDEAFHSAYDAGVIGFFNWGMEWNGHTGVEITPEDLEALELLGTAFDEGDILTLLVYALTHVEYMTGHFLDVLKTVEPFWGIIDSELGPFEGYDVLKTIAQEVAQKHES